ncbi:hypothetical protein HpDR35_02720 [Helicobacter pylori]
MRQEHETAKSFNELKAITQAIMFKKDAQASDNKRLKTEQANNSNLREEPSNKSFKPGLATHREKGGNDEA